MNASQDLPTFERHLQGFLGSRDTDVEAQAAVFNLDHAALDMVSAMESIALRPHDLTHAGFVLLMTLWITGSRETRELAAVLRVTKGAVVSSVNTLERAGLVRRVRSETDRRLVSVELTPQGLDLVQRAQRDWHALELRLTSGFTPEEKRELARLCRKMGRAARTLRSALCGPRSPELPNPDDFLPEKAKLQNELQSAPARR